MFADVDWNTLLLSPAGDVVVGMGVAFDDDPDTDRNLVCRYEIAGSAMTCAPIEPRGAGFAPMPIQTAWSLDGTQIALYEDAFQCMYESDIWVLDVETLTFNNPTDDGVYGKWMRAGDTPYTLDFLPVWMPNGDLYFFRQMRGSDETYYALFRLPQAQGEPEHVLDMPTLVDEFGISWRSLIALSPDGSQLAVLPRLFINPITRGLWIIDLTAQTVEESISAADLQVGFPDWIDRAADFDEGIGLIPQLVMWGADEQAVIIYGTPLYSIDQVPGTFNFLAVDMTSHAVTPLIDYNVYADEAAVYADSSLIPGMGWLAPDGGTLFFLSHPEADDFALYAAPVPLDAEPVVVQALTPEQYEALIFQYGMDSNGYMAQTGVNGNVLCGSMLFTLE